MWLPPFTQRLALAGAISMLAAGCSAGDDPSPASSPVTSDPAGASPPPTPESTPQAAPTGPAELLPDLRSLRAYDIHIERDDDDRLLRFSATLANVGTGPVEIRPNDDRQCPDGQRFATQVVHLDTDDGSGNAEQHTEPAGCMVDHEEHEHWHFDASARYVLTEPGSPRPIVSADKVSFCLRDSHPLSVEVGRQEYGECDRDSTQGISPGWGDEYASDLDGQALPLPADLPDGRYCLTLTADPYNLLQESDDANNAATVGVRINGNGTTGAAATNCVPPRPPE